MEIKKTLNTKKSELNIKVTLAGDFWAKAQFNAQNELTKNIMIPGFRKGKAPIEKIKNNISDQAIFDKAINKVLPSVAQKAALEIKNEIIISDPTYHINKVNKDVLEISLIYSLYPSIELKGYKNSGIIFEKSPISNLDINFQKQKLLEKYIEFIPSETEALAIGDIVIFDFVGSINGKNFKGGEAHDFELKLGSKQFIAGFEESLVGKQKGFEGEIEVSFPVDYHVSDYAGKIANFKIFIKEVKKLVFPDLNNDFIATLQIKDVFNLDDLNNFLIKFTEKEKILFDKENFKKRIFENIIKETNFELPESMVLNKIKEINNKFEETIKQQKITRKEYLDITNFTEEQIGDQIKNEAINNLNNFLVFSEFAKINKITIDEEDIQKEIASLLKIYKINDVEKLKSYISEEQIRIQVLNNKVTEKLIELNS